MFKIFAALALGTSLFVATPAMARDNHDKLGSGDYFVVVWPGGTPHTTGDAPGVYTTTEFDRMQYWDSACHQQLDKMRPSEFKSIFLTMLRNIPGAVAGGALGAMAGGFAGGGISAGDYGAYNGIATGGGSIGAGITGHEYGKHYLHGMCMQTMLEMARARGLISRDVRVLINPFPVNGHASKRPGGAATPDVDLSATATATTAANGDSDHDGAAAALHP